jgi:hypothetical protein
MVTTFADPFDALLSLQRALGAHLTFPRRYYH